ncbi:hypothetical protein BJ508DRAFT_420022 [Ascobolus immersus RN42]|uniref:Uncharacterized protein n=1 Tax=Ascobolus immersus RN42 TaxID=1160509 RepID=A0A3N4H8V6_ASCIM|nr:hypothetical protein BJ508DRAFT_420022 [Ascobolus immersus RN42]
MKFIAPLAFGLLFVGGATAHATLSTGPPSDSAAREQLNADDIKKYASILDTGDSELHQTVQTRKSMAMMWKYGLWNYIHDPTFSDKVDETHLLLTKYRMADDGPFDLPSPANDRLVAAERCVEENGLLSRDGYCYSPDSKFPDWYIGLPLRSWEAQPTPSPHDVEVHSNVVKEYDVLAELVFTERATQALQAAACQIGYETGYQKGYDDAKKEFEQKASLGKEVKAAKGAKDSRSAQVKEVEELRGEAALRAKTFTA